jgi:uncharacterized damage-inducible protein DinB
MSKTVDVYKLEIKKSINQLVALVEGTPENQLYWKPSEQEWSLMEVLAHVEEVVGYWVTELQRVIASPGTAWGRGMDDPARLEAIKNAPNRSFEEVKEGINKAKTLTLAAFDRIKDEDLEIESPHRNPKFGVKNLRFLVDHFLVEHIEKHVTQVKRVQNLYI